MMAGLIAQCQQVTAQEVMATEMTQPQDTRTAERR